jgi:hypothetical protein
LQLEQLKLQLEMLKLQLEIQIAARDPQRAEQPTLVNLFIFTLPFSYLKR